MRNVFFTAAITSTLLSPAASADVVEDWFFENGYDGAELSWDERSSTSDAFDIANLSLKKGPLQISADRFSVDENGFRAENIRIKNLRSGDGYLNADSILSTDLQAFSYLTEYVANSANETIDASQEVIELELAYEDPPFCDGVEDAGTSERLLIASGVRLVADEGSLPADFLSSETIQFEDVRITESFKRDGNICDSSLRTEAWDGRITAIDGAWISMAYFNNDYVVKWTTDGINLDQTVSFKLSDVGLFSSEGFSSARFDEMNLEMSKDDVWAGMLCLLGDEMSSTSELITNAFSTGQASFRFGMKNIDIDTQGFFGGDLLKSFGVELIDDFVGDINIGATLADGVGMADIDINMTGLLDTKAQVELNFPSSSGSTLPGFISDRLPVPGEILDVEIVRVSLAHQDLGFSSLLEVLTGLAPSDYYEKYSRIGLSRIGDKIPEFVLGKIDEMNTVATGLLTYGGDIEIAPEKPQKILTLAMQGMMNPQGLSESLGIKVRINKGDEID